MAVISRAAYKLYLGQTLKALRQHSGLDQKTAGAALGCTAGRIRHFETARNLPTESEIEPLLQAYGAPERITELANLVRDIRETPSERDLSRMASTPEPFRAYLTFEQGASGITELNFTTVPGLLQTPDYAAAVMSATTDARIRDREATRRVQQRLERQSVIDRTDPPQLQCFIDESVLYRQLGGRAVLRAQLQHLVEVSHLDHVSVRVIPFDRVVPKSLSGSFVALDFDIPGHDGLVFLTDGIGGQAIDEPEDIDHYLTVIDLLGDNALTEDQTRTMITEKGASL